MTADVAPAFGTVWFDALDDGTATATGLPGSVRYGETVLGGERCALLAVVPDPEAAFPRARQGEVGLEEGWALARLVRDVVARDADAPVRRPVVVVVDVPSQAYGYVEELVGLHQALAGAVDALASARLAGHPVITFVVGKAISGAFLATGLQANRIVALDHDGIAVQVMSKQSAARITRRTIAELDEAAKAVPAMAYDGASFARLGALAELVRPESPAEPTAADLAASRAALERAVVDARATAPDLSSRLASAGALEQRAASVLVRERVRAAWDV